MSTPTVFVTGATGSIGSALCHQLRALDWTVRSTVRDPDSAAAQKLSSAGVQLTTGTWDDTGALEAGLRGCSQLFLNLARDQADPDAEFHQARRILDLAQQAGVHHVVYSSSIGVGLGPDQLAAIGRADSAVPAYIGAVVGPKSAIEAHLTRAPGLRTWTILRPGCFMQNLITPAAAFIYPGLAAGRWATALAEDTALPWVDVVDIAAVAVSAFRHPRTFAAAVITLYGDMMTPADMVRQLGHVAGCRPDLVLLHLSDDDIDAARATDPMVQAELAFRALGPFVDLHVPAEYELEMGTFADFLNRESRLVKTMYG